jgi:pyruvate-ferredoxin/flavodoxin oxidoreductase
LLLNSPYGAGATWERLSQEVQRRIIEKRLRVYVIDGYRVAAEAGLGRHINTVMQVCFFALSKLLPEDEAALAVKQAVEASYGKKGSDIVRRNFAAIDAALAELGEMQVPDRVSPGARQRAPAVPKAAPDFVQRVTAAMIAGHGDLLPVSAFPIDGSWPVGTSRWEKRSLARAIPVWDRELCIQCNKCALVCPHAAIRAKVYPESALSGAPAGFQSTTWKSGELAGQRYTLQVAPEDCTGCRLCVEVCPAKDKSNPRHKAGAHRRAPRRRARALRVLPVAARAGERARPAGRQGVAAPASVVRILGGLRGLR